MNHPQVSVMMRDQDEDMFNYMTKLKVKLGTLILCRGGDCQEEGKLFIPENMKNVLSDEKISFPNLPPLCACKWWSSDIPLIVVRSLCSSGTTVICKDEMIVKECLIYITGKRQLPECEGAGAERGTLKLECDLHPSLIPFFLKETEQLTPIQFTDTRDFNIRHAPVGTTTAALTS